MSKKALYMVHGRNNIGKIAQQVLQAVQSIGVDGTIKVTSPDVLKLEATIKEVHKMYYDGSFVENREAAARFHVLMENLFNFAGIESTRRKQSRRIHCRRPTERAHAMSRCNGTKIHVSENANGATQVDLERPTPMHDRLRQVQPISQKLHEFFFEFLSEKGIELSMYDDRLNRLSPVGDTKKLIAEFLEIDLDELENEKRQMLIDMRTAQARRDAERELPMSGKKRT